ncbi:amino acid adenylation domain-containing protein [Nocardia cyriacigeorgica]|uniref:amino acid adenylation domain-containing protein n=1 Tax=Nocardia cyriacigeorgica TaxID=135487 RepID=UPI001894A65D|nr:non-ribosomal peptide synthetase [Nocardia cyriacigeorgica]MBF6395683.1 amino acid adenylation domain-containing protein [Nocardia cyriacigeorgica]MBF6401315.1 amino acid adenylation domain-containing protein [Nocardia cyriacigeorgica]
MKGEDGAALLPLTGPQLGIWNAQRFDPESGRYLVGEVLEITGATPIDVELLAEAIRRTVDEAENMRLRFCETPDGPRQFVSEAHAELRPVIDLRAVADPLGLAHEAVALERHRAAEHCRGMVDRQLYIYTLIRVTDCQVWCVQLYHHLIVDGYSAALLSRRVAAHYTALRRGTDAPKPTFGTIADLVAEERAYRDSDAFERDRRFWRDQLTPCPDLDGRGPHVGGVVERTLRAEAVLSAQTLATLHDSAESYGITWADALVACYAAFLNRQLGTSDVVVSMLLMGRVGRAALTTPAMAVNVLPLRLRVSSGDRLGELGPRVAETLREVRAHQRYSGDDLARDFHGFGAGELLHGVGINLKVFDFALDFDGAKGVLRNVAGGPPEDLGLTVTPLPDGTVLLGFESDARTNDPATVRGRVDGLVRVIEAFIGSDKPPVGALEVIDRATRGKLLAARSGPALPSRVETVPEALDRLVARTPGCGVLAVDGKEWTAAEFAATVNRLARYLRDRGVGPDSVVGVALPRTAQFVVSTFAIWRAGGVYLPLDPEHPVSRLRATIEDAAPVLVLVADELAGELGEPAVALDDAAVRAEIDAFDSAPFTTAGPRLDQGAYLIYTSGSTGRPKGVLVDHDALAHLLEAHRRGLFATPTPDRPLRVAHTTSFAFDASLDPLLWLLDGHCVHLYDSAIRRDPDALVRAFRRDGIDIVDGTPTLMAALLEHGLAGTRPHLVALGGEACPPQLWRDLQRSDIPAMNLYGPTEATVDTIATAVRGAQPHIGLPLPGARVYLLDNALQVVADSQIGELYLAGPQLARGYREQPVTTAHRFVADPYGPPGARMYRTGDRARWVPGRGYEYAGRVDAQVKIRGHRVELGEIEAALNTFPQVRAAAADIRAVGERATLVGYVVGESGGEAIDATQLRHRLADLLPDHMVPSRIVVLTELPTTVNGKIDRAALPEPASESAGRAPSTEAERALCEVVSAALGHDGVSMDDDFFGVGGDSITAITVSTRLRERGLVLAPQELLSRRGFGELALAAEQVVAPAPERSSSRRPLVELPQSELDALTARYGPIADVLPLSPLQEGLLYHALRDGTDDVYTMTARFDLAGPLDPAQLAVAVRAMLSRHPNLGAAFCYEFDQPVQVVPASPRLDWRVEDLRADADPELLADELERDAGAAPFDIGEPPLLRILVIRLTETASRLILTAHHLLADGWSIPIMLRETLALYHGDEPARGGYYGDYLAWLADRDVDAALNRWGEYLTGVERPSLVGEVIAAGQHQEWAQLGSESRLPGSVEREPGAAAIDHASASPRAAAIGLSVPLPESAADALESLGREHGVTMNTLLQGAWSVVLAEFLGHTDVVFGTVVSGRPAELVGVESTVGLFSNTVPARMRVETDRPLLGQLPQFQRTALELREVGFLGLATVERAIGRGRLFDTLVVFENFPKTGLRQPDSHQLRVADVAVHSLTHYPVTVTALPGDRFRLMLHHDPATVPEALAGHLAQRLADVLSGLVTDPASVVGALFSADDRSSRSDSASHSAGAAGRSADSTGRTAVSADRVDIGYAGAVSAGAGAAVLYPAPGAASPAGFSEIGAPRREAAAGSGGTTLVDWKVSGIDPGAPAVTLEGTTLTYAEFEARSNRLARWLIAYGIGPETVVAVAMARDLDSVIAAHAICRAGGVYLPIDLTQPARRVDLILATAHPALVLSTSQAGFGTDRAVVVTVDELDTSAFGSSAVTDDDRRAPLRPDNAAYLLFTSGSTGVPKGVSVSHAAIVNTFAWLRRHQGVGAHDTVLYRTPPTFDASLLELFLPLLVGARIVLTRPDGHRDPYYQAQLMRDERVTVMQMTTSMLTVLAEEADLSGYTDLRCVVTGGEALPPATAHRMRALTGTQVYNLYGPTEAAVCITFHETTDADTTSVPIGRPAEGSGVRVLDARLRPVPVGAVGELYLTGIQLARGYFARADLTAAAFVADPGGHGDRMYRTGDLVKWTADGELDYVGRADSQVKLRGQRIELGEIESALLGCDDVAQAVVLLREDRPGDQRLVGYLIAKGGAVIDTGRVLEQVRTALPAHMVPAAFVVLAEIPRTTSEKIDRKALPAPDEQASTTGQIAGAPGGPPVPESPNLVRTVLDAMAAVLSSPGLQPDDDFFATGGHSLTAVRLTGRLRRAGLAVVLDDVFAAPTARSLARAITAAAAPATVSPDAANALPRATRASSAAHTPAQETSVAAGEVVSSSARTSPPETAPDALAMYGRRLDHVLGLRPTGSAAPIFCVHPVGGTAWQFAPLARLLRADRPLVGLQAPTLSGHDIGARTLDELAAHYLETVRRIQPRGPYRLLGYSLGGNIVHGMAAALAAVGEDIAFVGLIDSHPLAHLAEQATRSLADPAELDRLLPELPEDAPELADAIRAAARSLLALVPASTAPRYRGPMALYAADPGIDSARTDAQLAGWRAAGARLTVRRLPYSHFDIVSPQGWAEVAALLDADPALRH